MRIQTKILFLPVLITLVVSVFITNCSTLVKAEDNTYLTPIPESTWSAYRESRPITNKFDAVVVATREIRYSRMTFTQGDPKVVFTEEMTLVEAKKLTPKASGEVYSSEDRPETTKVWLVIFEGSWQIAPPGGDLSPLESGCIYAIIDANISGHSKIRATSCQAMP